MYFVCRNYNKKYMDTIYGYSLSFDYCTNAATAANMETASYCAHCPKNVFVHNYYRIQVVLKIVWDTMIISIAIILLLYSSRALAMITKKITEIRSRVSAEVCFIRLSGKISIQFNLSHKLP